MGLLIGVVGSTTSPHRPASQGSVVCGVFLLWFFGLDFLLTLPSLPDLERTQVFFTEGLGVAVKGSQCEVHEEEFHCASWAFGL